MPLEPAVQWSRSSLPTSCWLHYGSEMIAPSLGGLLQVPELQHAGQVAVIC